MQVVSNAEDHEALNFSLATGNRLALRVLLVLGCALVVAATIWRSIQCYDEPSIAAFDRARQGQFDFHNGIYFPAMAFLQGYNPYGPAFAADFPVSRQIPPYSPFTLLLHIPLGLVSLPVAEVLYFCLTLSLCGLIASMTVSGIPGIRDKGTWMLIALLLTLASRAGHTTLFTGYFTVELVLGSLLALRFGVSRPPLSGLGIALASIKPNFAIPLCLLMAARGNWRALAWGVGMSVVGAALPLVWLLQNTSIAQFIADLKSSDSAHLSDDYEMPVNSWTRVDVLAVISKWTATNPGAPLSLLAMLIMLIVPCLALRALRKRGDTSGELSYSGAIIITASMSSIYHHVYDSLLLIPVAISLALDSAWSKRFSLAFRALLALGLLFVPWNYLSAEQILNRLSLPHVARQIITSCSAVVLVMCCAAICIQALKHPIKSRALRSMSTRQLKS